MSGLFIADHHNAAEREPKSCVKTPVVIEQRDRRSWGEFEMIDRERQVGGAGRRKGRCGDRQLQQRVTLRRIRKERRVQGGRTDGRSEGGCDGSPKVSRPGLRPTALAILRSDQCVPPGGFSLSVMLPTRSIVAASKGGLRPGRVASRSSPATPRAR